MKLAHCGTEHLISDIRQKYWPINARRIAKQAIRGCLYCHRNRVKPVIPIMADLPKCRVNVKPNVFYHTGVDYFGPIVVKARRNRLKRYGCIFTCLSVRTVHIELADSLDTDDFILVLRNFIGRRGYPGHIYSDNGTNFTGADSELKKCMENLDQVKIQDFLSKHDTGWHFNPPSAPHFGGAWERLVRSTKKALNACLGQQIVTESVLRTALIELESILNSRPLTHNSSDPRDYTASTPNHFLLGRANYMVTLDLFHDKEINSRKRWRQTQVIANHVNQRWLKEYLPQLTLRHRWLINQQSVSTDDLVMIVNENIPRGQWELGRVVQLFPGDDNQVRVVKVKTAKGEYIRPVAKLCLLEENVRVRDDDE